MQNIKQNILITGSHRSGTTWVGRTIAHHPRVRYIHEPFNVTSPRPELGFSMDKWFRYVPGSLCVEEVEQGFERLFNTSPFEYAISNRNENGITPASPLTYVSHFVSNLRADRLLIKDPLALISAGWLAERFKMKVICMIRSPLAFAGSLKVAGWTFDFNDFLSQRNLMETVLCQFEDELKKFTENPGDLIDQAALLWNILHYIILTYQDKYPDWLYVKHENLASNPIAGFKEMFSYVDLTLSEKIISDISDFTSSSNPVDTGTTRFTPRNAKKSLFTWKKRLTSEETDRVLSKTQKMASFFY